MLCWVKKWCWSSNCDVQSSSCARVRTRKEKVKMTKSWKILNIFLKKPSLAMGPITKVVAYAKKTLEIRGFFQWYWTWLWSRNEHFRSFHWKTGKRWFWWIEGFQQANVDILHIKMMEMDRPSISLSEKRGFSLKNESWWKIASSIGKMENGRKKRVCRGDEGPKLSWDVEWCPRIDLRSFREFSWFSRT